LTQPSEKKSLPIQQAKQTRVINRVKNNSLPNQQAKQTSVNKLSEKQFVINSAGEANISQQD
jgi:hypothetical protein